MSPYLEVNEIVMKIKEIPLSKLEESINLMIRNGNVEEQEQEKFRDAILGMYYS